MTVNSTAQPARVAADHDASRRRFLVASAMGAGAIAVMAYSARSAFAAGHSAADTFETADGSVTIHPISHASFVMETPRGVIHVDPVGDASAYADLPAPDLILVTHQHGDHYSPETLTGLAGDAPLIVNPAVFAMLPDGLKARATRIANGESAQALGASIEAIPAYNLTEGRLDFHPEGRDNGYVVDLGGYRVYISGDTEDVPEMRALKDIDLAFVCMNLPFTMAAEAAADAVAEFAPKAVYPYHYRGRDNAFQDTAEFAALVGDASEVKSGDWYG